MAQYYSSYPGDDSRYIGYGRDVVSSVPRARATSYRPALPPNLYRDPRYPDDELAYAEPAYPQPRGGVRTASIPIDGDPAYSSRDNYDIEVDRSMSTRVLVDDPTRGAPGSITINTSTRKLYLSLGSGQAIEYGIGVGRQGFLWKGSASVGRKASWPGWTPPAEMLKRRPDLPRHMEGGLENPLGARALYLFQGSKDTMFRIHGTNEPDTIGQAVSSGCIRMMNADVIDLYQRVNKGAHVTVI